MWQVLSGCLPVNYKLNKGEIPCDTQIPRVVQRVNRSGNQTWAFSMGSNLDIFRPRRFILNLIFFGHIMKEIRIMEEVFSVNVMVYMEKLKAKIVLMYYSEPYDILAHAQIN